MGYINIKILNRTLANDPAAVDVIRSWEASMENILMEFTRSPEYLKYIDDVMRYGTGQMNIDLWMQRYYESQKV